MKFNCLRISSMVLLLVALLALSGIAATAEALVHADKAGACCSSDSEQKESGSGPCSVPDCLCASCLTVGVLGLPKINKVNEAVAISFIPQQQIFPLSEFINSIDYPPEPIRQLVS